MERNILRLDVQRSMILPQRSYPFPLVLMVLTALTPLCWQAAGLAQILPLPTPNQPTELLAPTDEGYILGVGDRIRITLLGVEDYSGEYQILADGTINLPVVGQMSVSGMTVGQLTAAVTSQYSRYVRRPIVTLNLLEARPVRIAIAGEVNRPGAYNVNGTNAADNPTVTEIIQLAGGITQSADIRQVQIIRSQPQPFGASQPVDVDLWELLQAGDLSQDIRLRDGDTVIIPTATILNPGETAAIANASFSPAQIAVNVVGEVVHPGAITVPPNTPLNQAVLAAGGFNNRAARSSVELVRLNPNGTVSRQRIAIDLTQGVNEATNPPLRSNDTIIVGPSGFTQLTDTVGRVLPPLNGIFNLFRILGF